VKKKKGRIRVRTCLHKYFRVPVLSDEEWNLLFKVQKLLAPFTAVTKYLQPRPLAHLSAIIPFYQVIKTKMEEAGEDELSDARHAILIDLRSRIWDYMSEGQQKIVCIATFLDPRFKDRFFKDFIYNPKVTTKANDSAKNYTFRNTLLAQSSRPSYQLRRTKSNRRWS